MPTRSHLGSDMMKYNEDIQSIDCPFSGGKIGIVKAIVPDVGVIHVQRCDAEGNAQKWGTLGVDFEGINASKRIIITTEKIVESNVIQRDPNRTMIPGFRVSAVVEQPFGAYPSYLAGCYNEGLRGGGMEDETGWDKYVNSTIYGVKDWDEYLENLKKTNGADSWTKSGSRIRSSVNRSLRGCRAQNRQIEYNTENIEMNMFRDYTDIDQMIICAGLA